MYIALQTTIYLSKITKKTIDYLGIYDMINLYDYVQIAPAT